MPDSSLVQLVTCTDCGTLESVLPEPLPAGAGPAGSYLPHEMPTGPKGWLTARSQDRKALLVRPWAGGGKLVDIGCGSGGFMDAWLRKSPGNRAVGLEPSPHVVEAARARGLEVIAASLDEPITEVARGGALYTLWHVLEHLEDPVAALIRIRETMAPEGKIVLVVPNAAAMERSLFGARTIAWDPPRHRWHFTPEGLTGLAKVTNLRVLERFNLISDDLYDAVASLQWVLYPRTWIDANSTKGHLATGLALIGGVPVGLLLAALSPWRQRASLGMVLARAV